MNPIVSFEPIRFIVLILSYFLLYGNAFIIFLFVFIVLIFFSENNKKCVYTSFLGKAQVRPAIIDSMTAGLSFCLDSALCPESFLVVFGRFSHMLLEHLRKLDVVCVPHFFRYVLALHFL